MLNEQQFTSLVKAKPVKQEFSHTVILPPIVSVLWLYLYLFIYFRLTKYTLQILQQIGRYVNKMPIQYMVPGFELTAFGI